MSLPGDEGDRGVLVLLSVLDDGVIAGTVVDDVNDLNIDDCITSIVGSTVDCVTI